MSSSETYACTQELNLRHCMLSLAAAGKDLNIDFRRLRRPNESGIPNFELTTKN